MTTVRTALALSLAGSLLALGACSDDDPRPKIAPPESSSPTASASTSQTAEPNSMAAQEAALRRYFRAISEATGSGDSSDFVAASSESCANCQVLARNIEAAYSHGGRIESDPWRVTSVHFNRKAPLGMIWNVRLITPRERWYNKQNQVVKVVRPASLRIGLALVRRDDVWLVRELRINA